MLPDLHSLTYEAAVSPSYKQQDSQEHDYCGVNISRTQTGNQ